MILPTIMISSQMFGGKRHSYIQKCTYNSSAFLLCLQPGLICVKGVLNDWFITENTGGRVDPGFLTAVLWVRHPRLQQHLPGPFYNCTRTKLQLYRIKYFQVMRTLNNVTDIHSCNPNKWDPCGSIMYKILKSLVRFTLKKTTKDK